jgi:hypothetical protein
MLKVDLKTASCQVKAHSTVRGRSSQARSAQPVAGWKPTWRSSLMLTQPGLSRWCETLGEVATPNPLSNSPCRDRDGAVQRH